MSSQMPTRKSVQPVLKMIEDLKPSQKGKEIHQNGKGKAKKDKQSREGNEVFILETSFIYRRFNDSILVGPIERRAD